MNITPQFLAQNTKGRWINLPKENLSFSSVFTDTREKNPNSLFIALAGENFDAHNFLEDAAKSGATALCLEEGKYKQELNKSNLPALLVENTLKALQNIAKAYRQSLKDLKLIGITGSNGKTSTKEIVSQLLAQEFGEEKVYATKANTNNHIGVPLNILKISENHIFAVIELGTNHPGEIETLADIARPDIAVITSIGESHLEFFKDVYGVAEEKSSIFNYLKGDSLAIIPEEFLKKFRVIREKLYNRIFLTFSEEGSGTPDITFKETSSDINSSSFELRWKNRQHPELVCWKIQGKHQMGNASIAALIGSYLGITHSNVSKHLAGCHLTGMRMKIRKSGSTTIINDAYNANPTSAKAGLRWLAGVIPKTNHEKIFVVIGDMLELGEAGPTLHMEVLQTAIKLMPHCTHILVGPIFSESAKSVTSHNLTSLPNSEKAAEYIRAKAQEINIIYLKGSRGTKLEKIDQVFP